MKNVGEHHHPLLLSGCVESSRNPLIIHSRCLSVWTSVCVWTNLRNSSHHLLLLSVWTSLRNPLIIHSCCLCGHFLETPLIIHSCLSVWTSVCVNKPQKLLTSSAPVVSVDKPQKPSHHPLLLSVWTSIRNPLIIHSCCLSVWTSVCVNKPQKPLTSSTPVVCVDKPQKPSHHPLLLSVWTSFRNPLIIHSSCLCGQASETLSSSTLVVCLCGQASETLSSSTLVVCLCGQASETLSSSTLVVCVDKHQKPSHHPFFLSVWTSFKTPLIVHSCCLCWQPQKPLSLSALVVCLCRTGASDHAVSRTGQHPQNVAVPPRPQAIDALAVHLSTGCGQVVLAALVPSVVEYHHRRHREPHFLSRDFFLWLTQGMGMFSALIIIIIKIIKEFIKHKILSVENILSVCMLTRLHPHRHPHAHAFWLYKA